MHIGAKPLCVYLRVYDFAQGSLLQHLAPHPFLYLTVAKKAPAPKKRAFRRVIFLTFLRKGLNLLRLDAVIISMTSTRDPQLLSGTPKIQFLPFLPFRDKVVRKDIHPFTTLVKIGHRRTVV